MLLSEIEWMEENLQMHEMLLQSENRWRLNCFLSLLWTGQVMALTWQSSPPVRTPGKNFLVPRMAKHQDGCPGNDLARAGLALGGGMS